jgi:hypothetical protein
MIRLAVLVLLAAKPQPARVDTSGHQLATLQRVLEAHIDAVNACFKPSEETEGTVRVASRPSVTHVELVVHASGAVVTVTVKDAPRFDVPCLKTALLKLEFGPAPRNAVVDTVVSAGVVCDLKTCWWSWTE